MTAKSNRKNGIEIYASNNVIDTLSSKWILDSFIGQKNIVRSYLEQLAQLNEITGSIHLIPVQEATNPSVSEIDMKSDDGISALLRFYNIPCDESICWIPDFKTQYVQDFSLVSNNEVAFFDLDEVSKKVIPAFMNTFFENGVVRSLEFFATSPSSGRRITFFKQVEDQEIFFTCYVKDIAECIDIIDKHSAEIADSVNSFSGDLFGLYSATKKLVSKASLKITIASFNKDICTGCLTIANGKPYSYMLPIDSSNSTITGFYNEGWEFKSPLYSVTKSIADNGRIKFTFSGEVYDDETDKVLSVESVKAFATNFYNEKLSKVFSI